MENEPPPEASRTPVQSDLVRLCRELNAHGARYLVVGGFAVIHHGFLRATEDIDLLVEGSLDNQARIKKALEILPDKANIDIDNPLQLIVIYLGGRLHSTDRTHSI